MTPEVADTIFSKFGVPNAAELDKGQLKNYYIALVKKHHPDTGGKDEDMKYINAAYDVLKDPSVKTARDTRGFDDYNPPPRTEDTGPTERVNVEVRFQDDPTPITYVMANGKHLINLLEFLRTITGLPHILDPNPLYDKNTKKWNADKVIVTILQAPVFRKKQLATAIRRGRGVWY